MSPRLNLAHRVQLVTCYMRLDGVLQRGGIPAGLGPHDSPALMVGDAGEVALTAPAGISSTPIRTSP
jgi:hypothetical protein